MPTITVAANGHTTVLNGGWSNPSNAFASSGDNVYATAAPAKNSTITGDFSFPSAGVPAGATIDAVRIVVEGKLSATVAGAVLGVQGIGSATDPGAEQTLSGTTTETQITKTFSALPTLSQLNTAGFVLARVRTSKGNSNSALTTSVDFVRLEIDYTAAPTLKSATDSGSGAESVSANYPVMNRVRAESASAVEASGVTIAPTILAASDSGVGVDLGDRVVDSSGGVLTLLDDDFSDTQASGWVAPDVGGPWVVNNGAQVFKSGGKGVQHHTAGGQTLFARVDANGDDVEMSGDFSLSKVPTGSNFDIHVAVRSVDGSNYYRARIRVKTDATVWLELDSVIATVATPLNADQQVASGYVAGDVYFYRVQAVGQNATTLRAKVWKSGSPEPTLWVQTADASSPLQASAGFALRTFQTGITNAPLDATFDTVLATTLVQTGAAVASDAGLGVERTPTVVKILWQDDFNVAQAAGLPNADVGGAYTVNDSTKIDGSGSAAEHKHTAANQTLTARVASVSSQRLDTVIRIQQSAASAGANADTHVCGRMIGASDYYRCRFRVRSSDQHILINVDRVVAAATTTIGGSDVDKGAYTAGDWWWVRIVVTGEAGLTPRIQARVWKDGAAEPSTWDFDVSDTGYAPGTYPQANDLRGPGHPAMRTFLATGSTAFPTIRYDDALSIDPGVPVTTTPLTGTAEAPVGAEQQSIVDTGIDERATAVDTVRVRAIVAAETGAGSDVSHASTATINLTSTDSGTGVDSSPFRARTVSDSATASAQVATQTVAQLVEEFNDDAETVRARVVGAGEAATGQQAVSGRVARLTDAGSETDSSGLARGVTDSGSGVERVNSRVGGAQDSGEGSSTSTRSTSDSGTNLGSENGVGSSVATPGAGYTRPESGVGSSVATPAAALVRAESGHGVEASTPGVQRSATDSGHGGESSRVTDLGAPVVSGKPPRIVRVGRGRPRIVATRVKATRGST